MYKRLLNLIIHPQTGWEIFETEYLKIQKLILNFLIPFSLFASIISVFRLHFIGIKYKTTEITTFNIEFSVLYGFVEFLALVLGLILSIELIYKTFSAFKYKFPKQILYNIIIYSSVPALMGELFFINIRLSSLSIFFQLYTLVLIYYGFNKLLKYLGEKLVTLFVIALIIIIFIFTFIFGILNTVLLNNIN